MDTTLDQFEFYTWIETREEIEQILQNRYKTDLASDELAELESDDGIVHVQPGRDMPKLVNLTLTPAKPRGLYLGETWGDIKSEEVWDRIFDFQRGCHRLCVYVSGVGLPPENVEEFRRRASRSVEELF